MALESFSQVVKNTTITADGCLLWNGPNKGKYSGVFDGSKQRYGHRLAYELVIGPIPDGHVIDHKCRNKMCVNPFHLEPVTQAVNTRRGNAGGSLREDGTFKCKRCGCERFKAWRDSRYSDGTARACLDCYRKNRGRKNG